MNGQHFRTQFIVAAFSMNVTAAEVLAKNASSLKFDDSDFMFKHDLAAVKFAGDYAARTGLRVQCNLEPSSLGVGLPWLAKALKPGVVIELVERYGKWPAGKLIDAARALRKSGALVAMDDVTPTDFEIELIRAIRPDIIKVENRDALSRVVKVASTRHLIAERVETEWHAKLASLMGVLELQGYWCDDFLSNKPMKYLANSESERAKQC